MLSSSLAPTPLWDLDMGDSYPDVIWSQACPSVHPHRATCSPLGHWATSALAPAALVLDSDGADSSSAVLPGAHPPRLVSGRH